MLGRVNRHGCWGKNREIVEPREEKKEKDGIKRETSIIGTQLLLHIKLYPHSLAMREMQIKTIMK